MTRLAHCIDVRPPSAVELIVCLCLRLQGLPQDNWVTGGCIPDLRANGPMWLQYCEIDHQKKPLCHLGSSLMQKNVFGAGFLTTWRM